MKKTILITGATSGIGEAVARQMAGAGHRLILTGRRADRLTSLSHSLKEQFQSEVLTLSFDVRERSVVEQIFSTLPEEWQNIDVLLNNAGLAAGLAPIQSGDVEDWETMIDTNIKGLLYITRAVLPFMISRQKGHIINIGSIAGTETYPNGNVYCATKHAVNSLSEGMRMDLIQTGIKVSQILPGAVETEFSIVRFKGDTQRAGKVYEGFTPLSADDIASAITFVIEAPAHVNISDMMILPSAQASATITNRK
ncbi:MAG: SDR family oxidoreductase [Bacteroidales bacterium]